jgi:hypothetical protein
VGCWMYGSHGKSNSLDRNRYSNQPLGIDSVSYFYDPISRAH